MDGAKALAFISASPALARYPLIITGIAVEERELPPEVKYLAFVPIPHQMDNLLGIISRVVKAPSGEILPQ